MGTSNFVAAALQWEVGLQSGVDAWQRGGLHLTFCLVRLATAVTKRRDLGHSVMHAEDSVDVAHRLGSCVGSVSFCQGLTGS